MINTDPGTVLLQIDYFSGPLTLKGKNYIQDGPNLALNTKTLVQQDTSIRPSAM